MIRVPVHDKSANFWLTDACGTECVDAIEIPCNCEFSCSFFFGLRGGRNTSDRVLQDARLQIRDDAERERQIGTSNQGAGTSRIRVTGMRASSKCCSVPRIPARHLSAGTPRLARPRIAGRATNRSELLIKTSEGCREIISRHCGTPRVAFVVPTTQHHAVDCNTWRGAS